MKAERGPRRVRTAAPGGKVEAVGVRTGWAADRAAEAPGPGRAAGGQALGG